MTSANANVSRETADRIAAISTAPGRGGIGIVRVSGQGLADLAQTITGMVLVARRATHAIFRNDCGQPLDDGVALFFPAPHSFTGEDVLELHGHGGQAGLTNILRRCLQLGCRLARPGEFTERAFLNGKMDLAQAESVADMIDAGSTQAALSAARTLTGEFSRRVNAVTTHLVDLRVHVEATIDFPEEEISPADRQMVHEKLVLLCKLEMELSREASQGAVLRDGLTVVLIGKPNVGKSSLLNRLAGEDVAIVTAIPGTTRDLNRATINLDGVPIHLIDTAGLRRTEDEVEKIGIERAWEAINHAGAAMLISESGMAVDPDDEEIAAKLRPNMPMIRVHNKSDLYHAGVVSRETVVSGRQADVDVSALTGEGVERLRAWLLATAGWQPGIEGVFLARERHMVALRAAAGHLATARSLENQFDLLAEELRLAQLNMASITGEFTPDDLLGEIFSRFCIGK